MSDFFFAEPSYLSGASRVLDMWGQFDDYNSSPNGDIADARALFADWLTVGDELMAAMERYASTHPEKVPCPEVPKQMQLV